MANRRHDRPGGERAWILAAAVAVITLLFAWVIIPAILTGNPLSSALQSLLKMIGSLVGAFAGIAALKLYLERGAERVNTPVTSRSTSTYQQQRRSTYASRTEPNNTPPMPKGHAEPAPNPIKKEWSLDLLRSLEWKRFEDLCNAYSRTKGMWTKTTSLGADGGIDIRIYRESGDLMGVVQCKAWERYVGVNLIRELAGVMASEKVRSGVFITTSRFTPDAITFAERNGIILLDGQGFVDAIKALPSNDQERLLDFSTSGDYTIPTCPKCGVKMVMRKGYSEFWACPNYPRCREKIKIRRSQRK